MAKVSLGADMVKAGALWSQPSSVRCALFIKSRSRLLTGAVLEVINRSRGKEVSKAPLYINHHRHVEGLSLDALFVAVALSKPRLD